MKKILVSILAFLYLATSTGATVQLHYCMGKLVEKNFWHSDKKECSKCGMDKTETENNGCCKDDYKQVKLDADQKLVSAKFDYLQLLAISEPISLIEFPAISFSSVAEENPNSNAPPRTAGVAIYKRNCVFRI